MDKRLERKLDRIIELQEGILKELRRDQKITVESPSDPKRPGTGPYAGVTWDEWDAMQAGGEAVK